jgi:GAF domain-containing protein
MTTLSDTDLAQLEGAMLETYRRELGLKLNDRSRLKAVYGSHFFDADRQARLTVVCQAVAQLLATERSAVVMVAEDKATVVASVGLPAASSVPIEDTYCQHVVGSERELSIADSLTHALVCESHATLDGGVRSYLGVPLISQSGHIIGSLCVWTFAERHWSPTDVSMLASFAAVLMRFEDS